MSQDKLTAAYFHLLLRFPSQSAGSNSIGSRKSFHCFDQSCITLIESCRLSPCCESTSDAPSAGILHAGFWGAGDR
jgi:hypothetical protein